MLSFNPAAAGGEGLLLKSEITADDLPPGICSWPLWDEHRVVKQIPAQITVWIKCHTGVLIFFIGVFLPKRLFSAVFNTLDTKEIKSKCEW